MQHQFCPVTVNNLYHYIADFEITHGCAPSSVLIGDFEQGVSNISMLFNLLEKVTGDKYSYNIIDSMLNDKHATQNVVSLIQLLAEVQVQIQEMQGALPIIQCVDMVASDYERLLKSRENYGDSWCKRGGVGAFMMLARKFDRFTQFLDSQEGVGHLVEDQRAEGILDDIGDLRRYLLLCYGLRRSLHAEYANKARGTAGR